MLRRAGLSSIIALIPQHFARFPEKLKKKTHLVSATFCVYVRFFQAMEGSVIIQQECPVGK